MFVLVLLAIRFRQHLKKAAARIAEEKQRAEEHLEKAQLLSKRNFELNESLQRKKHSEDELELMKKAMDELSKEKSNELKEVIIKSSEVKIESLIGKGGFGEVHLATYRGTKVALKTLLNMNKENVQRFRHECFLTKNLNHPHVVRLIGVCWDDEMLGCALEYMPMGTLEDWLKKTSGKQAAGKGESKKMIGSKVEEEPSLEDAVYFGWQAPPAGVYTEEEVKFCNEAAKVMEENMRLCEAIGSGDGSSSNGGWSEIVPSKELQEIGCRCFERFNSDTDCAEALAILTVNAPPASVMAQSLHTENYRNDETWTLIERVGSHKLFVRG